MHCGKRCSCLDQAHVAVQPCPVLPAALCAPGARHPAVQPTGLFCTRSPPRQAGSPESHIILLMLTSQLGPYRAVNPCLWHMAQTASQVSTRTVLHEPTLRWPCPTGPLLRRAGVFKQAIPHWAVKILASAQHSVLGIQQQDPCRKKTTKTPHWLSNGSCMHVGSVHCTPVHLALLTALAASGLSISRWVVHFPFGLLMSPGLTVYVIVQMICTDTAQQNIWQSV